MYKKVTTLEQLYSNCNEVYNNASKYCYWYGGKNQKCTTKLLNTLSALYPNIYTTTYINKCKQDIKNKLTCIDCSGLVCLVGGVSNIGTSQFFSNFKSYTPTGKPNNGVICYRNGHCGIMYGGKVLQARGVDYDIQLTIWSASDWTDYFIYPNVDYSAWDKYQYFPNRSGFVTVVKQVIVGKYGNGDDRITKLKSEGYGDKEIKLIQATVNYVFKNVKSWSDSNINATVQNLIVDCWYNRYNLV